jgi:DNA-binding response OmpR family regulator
METHTPDPLPIFATFGRRKVRPCVCIVDRKRHIRTFLCNALEDLEFMTSECADNAELEGVLREHRPELVVLGLSAGGEEGIEVLNTLATKQFVGKVLLLGRKRPFFRT